MFRSLLSVVVVAACVLWLVPCTSIGAGSGGPPGSGRRTVVPTPPGGGPGTSALASDQTLLDQTSGAALTMPGLPGGATLRSSDDLGGDDVYVVTNGTARSISMDVASNGDIYLALTTIPDITVYRSRDGGETWDIWGTIDAVTQANEPALHVAEGTFDRCFVAFRGGSDTIVAMADLGTETASFTNVLAMHDASSSFSAPHITSDAVNFDEYYLYVVANADAHSGGDIWFVRSVNQGTSFESPYRIGTIAPTDRSYLAPKVAYGYGGYVHVAWYLYSSTVGFDATLRYRRASSFANGGLGAWDSIASLSPADNGVHEVSPLIAASPSDPQVVLVHQRVISHSSGEPGTLGSDDQGGTFSNSTILPGGARSTWALESDPSTGCWLLGGIEGHLAGIHRSNSGDFTSWSGFQALTDAPVDSGWVADGAFALDPSRGYRVAASWIHGHDYGEHALFDAEWRGGPGYPNFEEGYPLPLVAWPLSPPALVDLDGDEDLEIVWSDEDHRIHALHHDGTVLPGWPVDVGLPLSDGPVAIGDLNADGTLRVIVGTNDGRAFAYRTNGTLESGWPFDTGEGLPTYVSIGTLGNPHPRVAAIASGARLFFADANGEDAYGFSWNWPGRQITQPVAIGDVDGDGENEAIGAATATVFAVGASVPTSVFGRSLPAALSDAVTLGDLDLDDDVEVVVPLANGSLYVLQGDGSDFAGSWPFHTPSGSPLSSAAIATCLGGAAPEIAVASLLREVHLLYANGVEQNGFPVDTDGWNISGAPILGYVEDPNSADVVLGARGTRGWAFSNFGSVITGWPKYFEGNCYWAPAMGDIDRDGRGEIVFLTTSEVVVLDVNQEPTEPWFGWPMYGYDPQRTGCANCPDPATSNVESPEIGTITSIGLGLPFPNPAAGAVTIAYALPARAQVALEVFDIQGRRVASVLRAEVEAGEHEAIWNGLDRCGLALPNGRYLLRLRVRGPGIDEQKVRPVTRVR